MGFFGGGNHKCPLDGHICACCVFWHGERSVAGSDVSFNPDEWAKCDKNTTRKIKGSDGGFCSSFKSQYK